MLQSDRIKLLALFFAALAGCSRQPHLQPFRQTQLKLGTFVTLSVYDADRSEAEKRSAVREAFALIDSLDRIASAQKDSSELNLLNARSGEGPVVVSPLLFHILRLGQRVARETGGAFDPAIGAVARLWGFSTEKPHLPDRRAISEALPLVDFRSVVLDSPAVWLKKRGMALDLGGIAKGTAIDLVLKHLLRRGFQDVMVDAGGDLGIHSSALTRGRIRVWIRHPRKEGKYFAHFYADSGAVATSGDYEQFFTVAGKRYYHILNPKTGYPDSDVCSVTVVTPSAEMADALATGIFVLGWKRGIEFAKKHPELGVIILRAGTDRLQYWISANLKDRLKVDDTGL